MKPKLKTVWLAIGLGMITEALLALALWLLARRDIAIASDSYFIIPHFSPGSVLLSTAFFSLVYFGFLSLSPKFSRRHRP